LTFRYIEKLAPNITAMLLPSETPLILPLPQLDTEAVPTEKVDMDADQELEPPANSKPVTATRAPSPTASELEKQAQ